MDTSDENYREKKLMWKSLERDRTMKRKVMDTGKEDRELGEVMKNYGKWMWKSLGKETKDKKT